MFEEIVNKLTEFAENHPQLLMAAVICLAVLIIGIFAWPVVKSAVSGGKEPLSNKEEVQKLIKSINKKQEESP